MTTTTLAKRVHNFGAGPAALPLAVLEKVQAELIDYAGTGMSVLEMSHRSAAFEAIIHKAEEDLRALIGAGADHAVLFLQGGASLQFAQLPMNLRAPGAVGRLRRHRPLVEGRRQGGREVGPRQGRGLERGDGLRPRARGRRARARSPGRVPALHLEQHDLRHEWAGRPPDRRRAARADLSSDALSRPLDAAEYGLIYAGAQKNLGPAGRHLV